jgi:purine-binding chemotaxis protein CheW
MTAHASAHSTITGVGARQVLTFSLGSESYGVDIKRVQEIRGWTPVTRIPKLPPHVLGVLNLRGSIIPIIDLRARFNLAQAEFTALTVIIIVSVKTSSGERDFGLVVDGVSDVVDIRAANLQETPNLGTGCDFIQGLAIVADRTLILLNIDELLRCDAEPLPAADLAGVA